MNEYYWGQLINYWVKAKLRTGLSIPYILGARTIIEKDFKIDSSSVNDLFNEIKGSDGEEVITLQHCENIGEYVLGLNDPENSKDGLPVTNNETGKIRIIATSNTQVLGRTCEEIVKSLSNRYKDCLKARLYSRIDFKWVEFTSSDLNTIKEAILK